MIKLVEKYLYDNKYFPNSEEFNDYYLSHPDHPSLYAATDTLNFFGIENIAAKVSVDQFNDLPNNFITLFNTEKGDEFIYVTDKGDSSISYLDNDKKSHRLSKNQFITNWKEIIVAVDENENPVEHKKTGANKFQWSLIFFIALTLVTFTGFTNHFSWFSISYTVLSLIGLYLSVLITQENFGLSNEITAKICGVNQTDKGGCHNVLSSEGAKIYKNFTLSDACLVFFSTLSVIAVFNAFSPDFLAVISVCSIPVILYSIWYQKFKVKNWCPLCLGILITLIGIITLSFLNLSTFNIKSTIVSTSFFALSFLLIISVWVTIKPFIKGYFELKKLDTENKRFKRNVNTFRAILTSTQEIAGAELATLNSVNIGHKDAKVTLDLFLSPSCGHCHTAFADAYNLYSKFPEKLKLSIYFNVNIENENNPYAIIAKIMMQGYISGGVEKGLELLKDWHINKLPLEDFKKKYQTPISEQAIKKILSHFDWCRNNELNYTPVKIFQQKLMPNEYSIDDLKYFVNEFGE